MLGFGFAYISRMGEVSTLFSETNIGVEDGIIEDSGKGGLNEILPIPKPVTSSEDMEDEDSEEALEVEDGIEDDDFDFSELDEEDEEILDMSGALEMKKEVEEKISEKKEKKSEPSKAAFDYDLILDPTISTAIQASLAATPHEGFKPVVSVSKNGTLKIDFVPI